MLIGQAGERYAHFFAAQPQHVEYGFDPSRVAVRVEVRVDVVQQLIELAGFDELALHGMVDHAGEWLGESIGDNRYNACGPAGQHRQG